MDAAGPVLPRVPPDALDTGRIWQEIRADIPASAASYHGAIVAVRRLGYYDMAEQFSAAALQMFPHSTELLLEHCRAAEQRNDLPEALSRWRAADERPPFHPAVSYGLAGVLQRMGLLDEAERCLTRAMTRYAANFHQAVTDGWVRGLAVQSAECATNRNDWPAALERWRALHERFAEDASIGQRYREAAVAMNLAGAAATGGQGGAATDLATDAGTGGMPVQDLMLAFEGLGDSCEFGLTQRHFGVEPLGLLRWVSIAAQPLATALETRFEGVGDLEYTGIFLHEGQEYITTDSRYGMAMHTFVKPAGQDEAALMQRFCQRLHFLRRKLIEDLTNGEKIFVYQGSSGLSEAEILRIHRAVKSYNERNTMLFVTIPSGSYTAGHVRALDHGLLLATIPCGRCAPPSLGWNVQFETWRTVCTIAHDAFRGRRQPS